MGFVLTSFNEVTIFNTQCLVSLLYWTHNRSVYNSPQRQSVFIKVCKTIMFTLFNNFWICRIRYYPFIPAKSYWLIFLYIASYTSSMYFFLVYCILISQSTVFQRCHKVAFLFPLLLRCLFFGNAIMKNSDKVLILSLFILVRLHKGPGLGTVTAVFMSQSLFPLVRRKSLFSLISSP